jgi:hypothetical protein
MEVWLVILSSWCLEVVDHRGLLRSNKLVFNYVCFCGRKYGYGLRKVIFEKSPFCVVALYKLCV